MKIIIKNKKWHILFKNFCLICDVIWKNEEKRFHIRFELENKIIVTDKNKLRQLVLIFVDNAFKYTNEYDGIFINLKEEDNNIKLSIKDTGIGIKEDEIKYVFDRFFRGDDVRSQDIDGSGIGLSIAKMLSINLKYEINVDSKVGEYTVFEIKIPKVKK